METPRKFIIAELSIRKLGSSTVLYYNCFIISTDEDPSLRTGSSAMINLRAVSTKLYSNKSVAPCYQLLNRAIFDCATFPLLVRAKDEDLISIRTDIIPVHPFGDKRSLHFYHVTCKALGEQDLVVTIVN